MTATSAQRAETDIIDMRTPRVLGAYGVTMVLALFGSSALLRTCAPPPAVTTLNVVADCVSRTNNERTSRGLAALVVDARLNTAATGHSTYQAQNNLMTHTGAGGTSPGTRMTKAGYAWRTWGENVAAGQPDCASVIGAWMNSAGHRANILNPAFTNIGLAGVKSAKGTIYWTMDLAAPR